MCHLTSSIRFHELVHSSFFISRYCKCPWQNLVVPCVNSSPYRVCGTASYIFDDNVDFLGSSHRRSSTASTSAASSVSASPSVSATGHGPLSTRHLLSVGCVVPTLYIPGHGYVIPPVARPTSGLRTQWSNPRDYWRSRQRLHSTVPSSNRPVSVTYKTLVDIGVEIYQGRNKS